MPIIKRSKSIIPSCDVPDLKALKNLVKETCSIEGIGAYKIGFELVIPFGIPKVLESIRKLTDLPIIYDHQKAATDIPDTADKFVKACKGVNAIIYFPQSGPITEEVWIKAAMEKRMPVIVGGEMTHKGYLATDNGFLNVDAPTRIYTIAANLGVTDYVVPGNKPDKIIEYRRLLEAMEVEPTFYSPGLITQGGLISEGAISAGERWHAIIGRGIYKARNIGEAAKEYVKDII